MSELCDHNTNNCSLLRNINLFIFSLFSVGDENSKFALNVGGYSGNGGKFVIT